MRSLEETKECSPASLQESGFQDLNEFLGADTAVEDVLCDNFSYALKLHPNRVE